MDVVCFGEILWDLFERGPKAGAIARDFRRELGGAPANVAVGLARLGASVAIVGAVGRDRLGDALVADLRKERVDARFVQRLPQRTGLTFVVRDAAGEPEFLFYRQESADLAIRAAHVTAAMGRARWVLVGTSTSMTDELAAATSRFLDVAERAGAQIFVDLNVRAHMWPDRARMRRAIAALAGRAALVKASDADLGALGERKGRLGWLERNAPRATWLVTRGPGPASAIGPHGAIDVPAIRARCVDATGGGDAFIAGSLAVLVATKARPGSSSWQDPTLWHGVLRVGHMMGAKAVSRAGAVAGLLRLGRARTALDVLRRSFP